MTSWRRTGRLVTPQALSTMAVRLTGKSTTYKDAEGKPYYARQFIVPRVELNELIITDIPGVENLNGPPDFDGTIGMALIRNFNLLVDYSEEKVTLFRKDDYPGFLSNEQWSAHRFRKPLQLRVRFDFSDAEYEMGLDTGFSVTAIPKASDLGQELVSNLKIGDQHRTINTRTGKEVFMYNLEHIYLDGYDLGNNTCILSDAPTYMGNGLMGFDFFNNNKVFLDFGNGRVWLKRIGGSPR